MERVLMGHCGERKTGQETSTSAPGAVQNDRRILEQELKTQDNNGGTGTTGNTGARKEYVSSQNSAGRSENNGAGNEQVSSQTSARTEWNT
jgi:hypothetical protein